MRPSLEIYNNAIAETGFFQVIKLWRGLLKNLMDSIPLYNVLEMVMRNNLPS